MRNSRKPGHDYGNSSLLKALYNQYERWSAKIIKHPRVNIVLPLLIVILLSYNSILHFRSSSPTNVYIGRGQLINEGAQPGGFKIDRQLTMIQVWVESINEDNNILGKKSLLECLAFQNKITKGIPEGTAVNSPFEIWDQSLETLQRDRSPLHTINANKVDMPRYSFFKTWKVNGYITSAAGFIISVLAETKEFSKVQRVLSDNIEILNTISNVTSFHILASDGASKIRGESELAETFSFSFITLSKTCNLLLLLLHVLLIFYIIGSIRRHRFSIKSITGITIAMLTQIVLAITSSLTVTNLIFKVSYDNVPIRLFTWPITIILSSLQLRAIAAVSQSTTVDDDHIVDEPAAEFEHSTQEDNGFNGCFNICLSRSHFQSMKGSVVFSLAVLFLFPFSRRMTHFMLLSLWIGHFLQFTFFSAVLSLDFRRLDGTDLVENFESDIRLDDEVIDISKRKSNIFVILTSSRVTSLVSVLYLILCNQRYSSVRPSSSILFKLFTYGWRRVFEFRRPFSRAIFDQNFVAEYAFGSTTGSDSLGCRTVTLSMESPLLTLKSKNKTLSREAIQSSYKSLFITPSSTSSYKIDLYYALQFLVFIILALSCTLLLLQKLMERLDIAKTVNLFDGGSNAKHGISRNSNVKNKEDSVGDPHLKDQVQVTTTDHFHMKELYRGGHSLDIMMIATSKAPFVVSVGLDHCVSVWSPLVNPIPNPTKIALPRKFWPLSKVVLSNDGSYIAFFGENGFITTWSRRHMKFIWELKLKQSSYSEENVARPLEALFRKITVPAFRSKHLQSLAKKAEASGRRASVASSEFVPIVTGGLDATYEKVEQMPIDDDDKNELVFVTPAGLIYSVRDDGNIKVEELTSSTHGFKSCKLLSSPRVNDRLVVCDEIGDLYIATVVNNKWRTRKLEVNYSRILKPAPSSCEFKTMQDDTDFALTSASTDHTIELVSFVGLIVRVIGKTADLLDAQTGTVIRSFAIDRFKPNSLRVFHDSPVHCKFCGSASVASFSIAYSNEECERVTMHTYKLESKTKTSICLRVERDLREIRCLGMESAIDTVHYIYDVEDWCVTDNNLLIGIRKIPQQIGSTKIGSSSISVNPNNEEAGSIMSRRKENKPVRDESSAYLVHNIWEGWTMSATGKFSLHKIPVGVNGLVSDRLGPLAKFGAKAVIVGFANVMDMFYIGHEDLIFSTETGDASKEETGLRFVNKRRDRFSHRKLPINYNSL